ncbi:type II toxin-antitoxin system mRNA interferase toxin, RelE/StbE family [Candidatus Woesearchaeota archaeon]|nr:type II toxin-antitoxin system mRNA interferase toxin, RelE/StbE family [Candidatus Woesearchaeota archaeon]
MTYDLDISGELDKKFGKLAKKDKKQLEIINKKVEQIRENPHHFKPLRGDMKGSRRVHIDKSFVLTYEIDVMSIMITSTKSSARVPALLNLPEVQPSKAKKLPPAD